MNWHTWFADHWQDTRDWLITLWLVAVMWIIGLCEFIGQHLYCTSAVIAAFRVAGASSPAFQAIAHLWTGGLIAAYILTQGTRYARAASGLVAAESIMFLVTRL